MRGYHFTDETKQDVLGIFFGIGYVPTDSTCGGPGVRRHQLLNNNNPFRFISIYVTYQSIIHKLNISNLTLSNNTSCHINFEKSKISYMYIISEKESNIESYNKILISKYHVYQKLF